MTDTSQNTPSLNKQTLEYDTQNIFARILRKEVTADIVYEDERSLAFRDISPQANIHVLVIPKAPISSLTTQISATSTLAIGLFWQSVYKTIQKLELKKGFRIIINESYEGGQEVPHMHVHILGGQKLGPMTPFTPHF